MTTQTMEIRQEVVLRATREAVWNALATPEGWTSWFSDAVEGHFKVGESMIFDEGKYGKTTVLVVEREELKALAYRWHPGECCPADKYPQSEMTTVRFELADHADGTKVTVTETGFENIPEERRKSAIRLNTEGWAAQFRSLQKFIEGNGT